MLVVSKNIMVCVSTACADIYFNVTHLGNICLLFSYIIMQKKNMIHTFRNLNDAFIHLVCLVCEPRSLRSLDFNFTLDGCRDYYI